MTTAGQSTTRRVPMSTSPYHGLRFAPYIRVSSQTGRTADRFNSPDDQRDDITRWETSTGAVVVRELEREEINRSGADNTRPGWQDLIARCEAREIDGIVVALFDRGNRDLASMAEAVQRLE